MHVPLATYRLQLCPDFGFSAVQGVLDYLADLGISDVYASPVFSARAGSRHGYDVVDPNQLNGELGKESDFLALMGDLRSRGMGWLQDVVPNHMAFSTENSMLMDVLENGRQSPFYRSFDIDWDHSYENLRGRLLAPFLGRFYAEALESGEITLGYDQSGLCIRYFALRLPLKMESYCRILEQAVGTLEERCGGNESEMASYLGVVQLLKTIESAREGRRELIRHTKGMLWKYYCGSSAVRESIDEAIACFNGRPGQPETFNELDHLIADQHYRLSYWKVAAEEINYRRFFTVNDLIGLRLEEPQVARATHELVFRCVREGHFQGLRVDHIDGLYDPRAYLDFVRLSCPEVYLVVEKILALDEQLPEGLQVQGTTGYDFMNHLNGIFCDPGGEKTLTRVYTRFSGMGRPYERLFHDTRQLIIGTHLAGNIDNLAQLLKRISGHERHGADITLYGLRRALVEVLSNFPVYRTYVAAGLYASQDRAVVREAIRRSRRDNPRLAYELAFIERFLLLDFQEQMDEDLKQQWLDFVMSFQQLSGAVAAKGVEDTLLYVYNRLVSLNEVGGDPNRFGVAPAAVHRFLQQRAARFPHSMNATETHDTKRSEDVRARLNVLSELAPEWGRRVRLWARLNRRHKRRGMPDANDEYLLYQTLLGTWPEKPDETYACRIRDYLVKAVREAKVHTAWIRPDQEYEDACSDFVTRVLDPGAGGAFLDDFLEFQPKVAFYGMLNALAQVIVKCTAPGVPDFYQGSELWDLHLVDPDNRAHVNYDLRHRMLTEISRVEADLPGSLAEVLARWPDGSVKLFLIRRLLQARRCFSDLFRDGSCGALEAAGACAENLFAFERRLGKLRVVVCVPRLVCAMVQPGQMPCGELWQDTRLRLGSAAAGSWCNCITGQECICRGGEVLVGELCARFPGAVLVGPNPG